MAPFDEAVPNCSAARDALSAINAASAYLPKKE
jgi:hypothetical protein